MPNALLYPGSMLTAKIYTDASQLPIADAVHRLPWVEDAIDPQKTDFDGLLPSSNDNKDQDFFATEVTDYETNEPALAGVVSDSQVWEREGFEPSIENPQSVVNQCSCKIENTSNPQIAPQELFADDPELAQLVMTWERLPTTLKRAVMAIVGSF